jgi:hypothetical protein
MGELTLENLGQVLPPASFWLSTLVKESHKRGAREMMTLFEQAYADCPDGGKWLIVGPPLSLD